MSDIMAKSNVMEERIKDEDEQNDDFGFVYPKSPELFDDNMHMESVPISTNLQTERKRHVESVVSEESHIILSQINPTKFEQSEINRTKEGSLQNEEEDKESEKGKDENDFDLTHLSNDEFYINDSLEEYQKKDQNKKYSEEEDDSAISLEGEDIEKHIEAEIEKEKLNELSKTHKKDIQNNEDDEYFAHLPITQILEDLKHQKNMQNDKEKDSIFVKPKSKCTVSNVKSVSENKKEERKSKIIDINNSVLLPNGRISVKIDDNKFNLEYWGIPSSIIEVYHENGIKKLYPWQVCCLDNHKVLEHKENLVYSASTSAGKTLVTEILMIRNMMKKNTSKNKCIFIVPYVALAEEKVKYFEKLFKNDNIVIGKHYAGNGGYKFEENEELSVCVIEKANSLINHLLETEKIDTVSTIVIDEVHQISDDSRGYLLELLLTKLRYVLGNGSNSRLKGRIPNLQIIAMSATLPNISSLATWLNAHLFVTDYRPIPLSEYYLPINRMNSKVLYLLDRSGKKVNEYNFEHKVRITKMDVLISLLDDVLKEGKSVLIFCSSRNTCEEVAKTVSERIKDYKKDDKFVMRGRKITTMELKRTPAAPFKDLRVLISKGIAYHHAGLMSDERSLVEHSFKRGYINILTATTTLSAGVNLPAKRVVFYGLSNFIDTITYKQSSGRAGRAGYDTEGDSVILTYNKGMEEKAIKLMNSSLKPMISCLSEDKRGMKRALIEVISSNLANSTYQLEKYIERSLFYFQNPIEVSKKTFAYSMDYLLEKDLVKYNSQLEKYEHTKLGNAIVCSSFSPEDGVILFQELLKANEKLTLNGDLNLLYFLTPLNFTFLNGTLVNILKMYETFKKDCQKNGMSFSTLHRITDNLSFSEDFLSSKPFNVRIETKRIYNRFAGAILLYELINESPLYEISKKYLIPRGDLLKLQSESYTFCTQVVTFCHFLKWTGLKSLFDGYKDRLNHGIQLDILPIVQISNIKPYIARSLYESGYRSVELVAASNINDIERVLLKAKPFQSQKYGFNIEDKDFFDYIKKKEREYAKEIIENAKRMLETKLSQILSPIRFVSSTGSNPSPSKRITPLLNQNLISPQKEKVLKSFKTSPFSPSKYKKLLKGEARNNKTKAKVSLFQSPQSPPKKKSSLPGDTEQNKPTKNRIPVSNRVEKKKSPQKPLSIQSFQRFAFQEKRQATKINIEQTEKDPQVYGFDDFIKDVCEKDTPENNHKSAVIEPHQKNPEEKPLGNNQLKNLKRKLETGENGKSDSILFGMKKIEPNQKRAKKGFKSLAHLLQRKKNLKYDFYFIEKEEDFDEFVHILSFQKHFSFLIDNGTSGSMSYPKEFYQTDRISIQGISFCFNNEQNNPNLFNQKSHSFDEKETHSVYYIDLRDHQNNILKSFNEEKQISFSNFKFQKDKASTSNLQINNPNAKCNAERLLKLKRIFEETSTVKICTNIKGQYILLLNLGIELDGRLMDPKIGLWILSPKEMKKEYANIDDITSQFSKTLKLAGNPHTKAEMVCQCTVQTLITMNSIYKTLILEDLVIPYEELEIKLIPVLSKMEFNGVGFDGGIMSLYKFLINDKLKCLQNEANSICKENGISNSVNLSSHDEVSKVIYDELKLKVPGKVHKVKSTKSTRSDIIKCLNHRFTDIVVEYRSLKKSVSDYITNLPKYKQMSKRQNMFRICSKSLQTSSSTGRLAFTDPNLQSIPNEYSFAYHNSKEILNNEEIDESQILDKIADSLNRQIPNGLKEIIKVKYENEEPKVPTEIDVVVNLRNTFVAQEGYVLISADYKQVEFRLLAHFSGDDKLAKTLSDNNCDIFRNIACHVYNHRSESEVSDLERKHVKKLCYGLIYGMGYITLARDLNISTDESKKLKERFEKTFPNISIYKDGLKDILSKFNSVRTLGSRKRYFPAKGNEKADRNKTNRQALSTICQGSAADFIKLSMILIDGCIERDKSLHMSFPSQEGENDFYYIPGVRLVLQIHDELLFEVKEEYVDRACAMIKYCMENAAKLNVLMPVRLCIGKYWGSLKDYTYPYNTSSLDTSGFTDSGSSISSFIEAPSLSQYTTNYVSQQHEKQSQIFRI